MIIISILGTITDVITSSTFWTAVSAIATFAMAFITYKTLKQNKEQLETINEQRLEDTRARIRCLTFISDYDRSYVLKFENIGKEPAYDIKIKVSGEPITNNLYSQIRNIFSELANSSFSLSAGQNLCFCIFPSEDNNWDYFDSVTGESSHTKRTNWLNEYSNKQIIIEGKYNSQYDIHEVFTLKDRFVSGSYSQLDTLSHIAKIMVDLKETLKEKLTN